MDFGPLAFPAPTVTRRQIRIPGFKRFFSPSIAAISLRGDYASSPFRLGCRETISSGQLGTAGLGKSEIRRGGRQILETPVIRRFIRGLTRLSASSHDLDLACVLWGYSEKLHERHCARAEVCAGIRTAEFGRLQKSEAIRFSWSCKASLACETARLKTTHERNKHGEHAPFG